jgi:hypothetical protein
MSPRTPSELNTRFHLIHVFGYCSARTGAYGYRQPRFQASKTLIWELG